MTAIEHSFPLVTVGIVVLNREWIIGKMLASLQDQTYPHDRIHVVVVDGGSRDCTVKVTEQLLSRSNFSGYEIIVQQSNIPEARNLCISKMRGDFMLFWDSDVIAPASALSDLVAVAQREGAAITSPSFTEFVVDSANKIDAMLKLLCYNHDDKTELAKVCRMGFTLISQKVFNAVTFDPDLTVLEDCDFTLRARAKGFTAIAYLGVVVFDANVANQPFADVYGIDVPLRDALRGVRKRTRIQALMISENSRQTHRYVMTSFFLRNVRYLLYMGYVPATIVSIIGLTLMNLILMLAFPAYFLCFLAMQIARQGAKRGAKAAVRSLLVGVPTAFALLYYGLYFSIKPTVNPFQ